MSTDTTLPVPNGKIVLSRYDSGVTEMSAYINTLLPGALDILVASARRGPGDRNFKTSYGAQHGEWRRGQFRTLGLDETILALTEECDRRNAEVAYLRKGKL